MSQTTYFQFQDKQIEGAAMGSPLSPIIANTYMEYFEQMALRQHGLPSSLLFGTWNISITKGSQSSSLWKRSSVCGWYIIEVKQCPQEEFLWQSYN